MLLPFRSKVKDSHPIGILHGHNIKTCLKICLLKKKTSQPINNKMLSVINIVNSNSCRIYS